MALDLCPSDFQLTVYVVCLSAVFLIGRCFSGLREQSGQPRPASRPVFAACFCKCSCVQSTPRLTVVETLRPGTCAAAREPCVATQAERPTAPAVRSLSGRGPRPPALRSLAAQEAERKARTTGSRLRRPA